MSSMNLDEIIKKYSDALVEMGQLYGGEVPIENEEAANECENQGEEETYQMRTTDLAEEKNALKNAKTEEIELENDEVIEKTAVKAPRVNFEEGEATSSAEFVARVFTGEETYPVKGAKVVVYRGDTIYAVLETDDEGKTPSVKLPAFSEGNSLEADNPDISIDYSADVFAPGFVSRRELLVSAVGGSDIVLNVLLTPNKEGIG